MGNWIPEGAPSWFSGNVGTLRSFLSDPTNYILGVVAGWFVSGLLGMTKVVVGAIMQAFDPLINVTSSAP